MNVMVFDVAAENSGALTILKKYYEEAINHPDKSRTWYFIVSLPELLETPTVKILRFKWVKKSWFHRLFFDYFIAAKLVRKYAPNKVLSLQNVLIPFIKTPQILYLHNSLPFVDIRFKLSDSYLFWIYQNLISKIIFKSIKKAEKVIVQTNWMKDACVKKVKVHPDKFEVKPPNINISIKKKYKRDTNEKILFFYPASGMIYKNHKLIVEAVKDLKKQKIKNYSIIFTLKGDENKNVEQIYKIVIEQELPIEFIGWTSSTEVYKYYSKSILIFPSYVESFPLPILEARMHGSPILVSNCAFSHEILDGYEKVEYFEPFNKNELLTKMLYVLTSKRNTFG